MANLTQRDDGQWRGVEVLEVYRSQAFATAVYRSTLARTAQSLGDGVTLTGQRGEWELSGYARRHIEAFSQRRHDITRQLAAHGVAGAAAVRGSSSRSR